MSVIVTGLYVIAMAFPTLDPAWIALIGTIFGGVGLKVVESWLSKTDRQQVVRRDLHQEVSDLMARLDTVEAEVTHWRNAFYAEQERGAMLRIQLIRNGILPMDTEKEAHLNEIE